MAASACKLTITIDLSFDELMIDKDIAKLTKQILRCYTLNRRAKAPMQFSLTSFTGKSRASMEKHNGYEHWDVSFYTESYINIYPKDKIIYLTSESNNVIDNLQHDCIYVIGGLVDHNAHKGMCHKLAVEAGVKHGRLPLDKFLQMKARKVLTVDHVFEILLRVSEGDTWQEAFLKVLPERKNALPIVQSENELRDTKTANVNNSVAIDIKNVALIDVNNTVTVLKGVCDKESSRSECNIDSKEILKSARLIAFAQSKDDALQDSKLVDVHNVISIDISNSVSIDVNNTVAIAKDVCINSDSKSECNVDLKEILNKNSCVT
ncbi:tRNA methyltransferase 10 homolog A isoform X2 [Cardiocondyla obscurior]